MKYTTPVAYMVSDIVLLCEPMFCA